jgi:hypothetical protein
MDFSTFVLLWSHSAAAENVNEYIIVKPDFITDLNYYFELVVDILG